MMLRAVVVALVLALPEGAALAGPTSDDPAKVPAGSYVMDKDHASLVVRVSHMGFSNYTMRFGRLDGAFAYDPADWAGTRATIQVDPASIDTGQPGFNKEIAGPKFFDAAKYPTISFVSTSVAGAEGKGQVTGDLTFHGVTRPVTLDVVYHGVGPGMLGVGTRMGFSGTTRIKRSDFGVTAVDTLVGDDVDLQFEVEFTKK